MNTLRRVAISASSVMALACADTEKETVTHPEVTAAVSDVRVEPYTESIGAIGIVVGRPGGTARLSSPLQSRISGVQVIPGQTVSRGTVLVTLDQTVFDAATRSTQAALASAQKTYDRTRRLVDEGISPRKDLDQATADLARARADASTAIRSQQLSVLRSPISGIVTSVTATLGGTADPSQALVEISDPSLLDIVFNVTSEQASRVKAGNKVTLSTSQTGGGEVLGVATVLDVSGAVDTLTHAVAVRAHAPTTRRALRISETMFGQIGIAVHPNAIVIPVQAIVPEGDVFKVFVVDKNMIAHSRAVTVGGRNETTAEILSGLKAGERVVTVGAYGVEDSAKIVSPAADSAGGGA